MKFFYLLFLLILFNCQSKSSRNKEKNTSDIKVSQRNNNPEKSKKSDKENSVSENLYYVFKVIDGDTFYCYDGESNEYKIRLIGIDTPELQNRGKKKKGLYAKEAKEYLTRSILNKKVLLEFDLSRNDQYGRVLAYVFLEDKTFINAELVKNGYARIQTVQPNVKYSDYFYELQVYARKNSSGLWAVEEY